MGALWDEGVKGRVRSWVWSRTAVMLGPDGNIGAARQVDARANINLDPVISRLESARSGGGTANGGEGQEDRRQTHDGRFEWKRSDLGEAGYHMFSGQDAALYTLSWPPIRSCL